MGEGDRLTEAGGLESTKLDEVEIGIDPVETLATGDDAKIFSR